MELVFTLKLYSWGSLYYQLEQAPSVDRLPHKSSAFCFSNPVALDYVTCLSQILGQAEPVRFDVAVESSDNGFFWRNRFCGPKRRKWGRNAQYLLRISLLKDENIRSRLIRSKCTLLRLQAYSMPDLSSDVIAPSWRHPNHPGEANATPYRFRSRTY